MANSQVESTSSYQYDSLGRCVAKQWEIKGQTGQKRFLWQGLRMLREEEQPVPLRTRQLCAAGPC